MKRFITMCSDNNLIIRGSYIGLSNIQNAVNTVKNTSEGIICVINPIFYKIDKWIPMFKNKLKDDEINIKKSGPTNLLINKKKYISCSTLNKNGISQISL